MDIIYAKKFKNFQSNEEEIKMHQKKVRAEMENKGNIVI